MWPDHTDSHTFPSISLMSFQITNEPSVPELLDLLNEKLDMECAGLREDRTSPSVSPFLLEPRVSMQPRGLKQRQDLSRFLRSEVSKRAHAMP